MESLNNSSKYNQTTIKIVTIININIYIFKFLKSEKTLFFKSEKEKMDLEFDFIGVFIFI